jgi:hypothetical protein
MIDEGRMSTVPEEEVIVAMHIECLLPVGSIASVLAERFFSQSNVCNGPNGLPLSEEWPLLPPAGPRREDVKWLGGWRPFRRRRRFFTVVERSIVDYEDAVM